ncbi:hypothetical protein [Amycolatopsis saalfeldensis]|uniref:hypothetical protein n=1 Tax=Amycolatopsis saalfeldensis TaxID=394193 RepID=UPI0011603454|nr:hypothetical protein [Amycolatopsis saalfeldensis]
MRFTQATSATVAVPWRRAENADLRKLVQIYEESIRQLTLTTHDLREKVNTAATLPTLPTRGSER